jgi:hypothetical protein
MPAETDNFGGLALSGVLLIVFGMVRLLALWVRNAPAPPDPWGPVQATLREWQTPETCPRCSTPQDLSAWFCPHCGTAVGPYNNVMPYLNAFSQGEVFRNGVLDRMRAGPLTVAGYALISLNYLVFAPVYLFLVFRNLGRPAQSSRPPNPESVAAA